MSSPSRFPAVLLLISLACVTIATRWSLIERYSSPVPFHDQWAAEGGALIAPYFAGNLAWRNFFEPSNEHRPVLTRVLAFTGFKLTGAWDTQFQMTVNSLFYALIAVALSLIARQGFGARGWIIATVALTILFALPANYENALWGFQSQFYLMVLLAVVYLGGTFRADRIGPQWIAAQVAGVLGLFSMAGGIIAPLAAAGIALLRLSRRRDAHSVATLAAGLALAVAGWWLLAPTAGAGDSLRARSAAIFVEALLALLSWPLRVPLLAVALQMPWLLIAARILLASRTARKVEPFHTALTALGSWVVLQAAAIAFTRGGFISEIPPRYFDVLIVGIAVNAACLSIMARETSGRLRVAVFVLGGAWLVVAGAGVWQANSPARLGPILDGAASLQQRTLQAAREYIQTGDPGSLTRDPQVAHHFPSVAGIQRLLDDPQVRASLPTPLSGIQPASLLGRSLTAIRGTWLPLLVLSGLMLLAVSLVAFIRHPDGHAESGVPNEIPWRLLASMFAGAAILLVAAGMRPWDTDPVSRIARLLKASGQAPDAFTVPGAAGGIFAERGTPAHLFFGTYLDGDAFTGELVSSEFSISASFVLIPVTGYPKGPGNSLRLELLADNGSVTHQSYFNDRAPGERIGVWTLAVIAPPGSKARLVLSDQSREARGWLGVGVPRLSDDASAARSLEIGLESARAENASRLPALMFGLSLVFIGIGLSQRKTIHRAAGTSP